MLPLLFLLKRSLDNTKEGWREFEMRVLLEVVIGFEPRLSAASKI